MTDTLRTKLAVLAADAHEGGYLDDEATIRQTIERLDQLMLLVKDHVREFHARKTLSDEACAAIYSEDASG